MKVRLSDIDAPELDELGGEEAKGTLSGLVLKAEAYLDVDDVYVVDRYNRLMCVVYVRHNNAHILNVNKWLVDEGYATIVDYPNEFDSREWTLYAWYPIELEIKYEELVTEYGQLKAMYDRLKSDHDELELNYERLRPVYEELSEAFEILNSNYKRATSDLKVSSAYGR